MCSWVPPRLSASRIGEWRTQEGLRGWGDRPIHGGSFSLRLSDPIYKPFLGWQAQSTPGGSTSDQAQQPTALAEKEIHQFLSGIPECAAIPPLDRLTDSLGVLPGVRSNYTQQSCDMMEDPSNNPRRTQGAFTMRWAHLLLLRVFRV